MKKKLIVLLGGVIVLVGAFLIWKWTGPRTDTATDKKSAQTKYEVKNKEKKIGKDMDSFEESVVSPGNGSAPAAADNGTLKHKEGDNASQRSAGNKKSPVSNKEASREDEVITPEFLRDLARQVFEHYIPADAESKEPRFTLTFREVNTRYGLNMYGIKAEGGTISSMRKHLFRYVFSEKVLSFLTQKYTPVFIRELVSISRSTPKIVQKEGGEEKKVVLKDSQIADMLRRFARRLETISTVLGECMQKKNKHLVSSYIKAEKNVHEAYFAYRRKKENNKDEELGRRIKETITAREKARSRLAGAFSADGDQAVYIAKWAFRRYQSGVCKKRCLQMFSKYGKRVADRLMDKAKEL